MIHKSYILAKYPWVATDDTYYIAHWIKNNVIYIYILMAFASNCISVLMENITPYLNYLIDLINCLH